MRIVGWVLVWLVVLGTAVWATPSTEYWTSCIVDVQAPGTTHLGIDNYFTVNNDKDGEAFPTDVGLTWGMKVSRKLNAEIGIDLLEPSDDPLYLNAKIGAAEGVLGKGAPGVAIGIFNVGTHHGVTDQNVIDLVVGKTLPNGLGRLHMGGYWGSRKLLRDADGHVANKGVMVGWDRWLKADKVLVAADWASGKNALGGGGVGVYYFFTKDISVLTGPVWFNEQDINGRMKWTTQVDVNF
jgi:hypothetical protein